ncbi:MAG: hypothetical protein AAFQ98_26780, partial [Bacteroidota bacterium]
MKTHSKFLCAMLVFALLSFTSSYGQSVSIGGPLTVNCGAIVEYSAHDGLGSTVVDWEVVFSNGTSQSRNSSSHFTVIFPNGNGSATITARSGSAVPAQITVTYSGSTPPPVPGYISGPAAVCGNNSTHTYSISAVSGAASYAWSVGSGFQIVHPSNGSLVTSYTGPQTSISVRFPNSGSTSNGQISVAAVSGGACSSTSGASSRGVRFGPQTY